MNEFPTLTVLAIRRESIFNQLVALLLLPGFDVPILAGISLGVAGLLQTLNDHQGEVHLAFLENPNGQQANLLLSTSEISGLTAFPDGNPARVVKSLPVRLRLADGAFNSLQKTDRGVPRSIQ